MTCDPSICTNGKCRATAECIDVRHAPKPRTVVAFTGLAGSGKSTAAAHLVDAYGYERVRFAGPLKAMLKALGLSDREVDGDLKETPSALLCGKTPRQAMQTLGAEWGRDLIHTNLWISAWRAAVDRLPEGMPVVVDDLRFPNEAEAVRALGGILVRVFRPGAGTLSAHVSEQHELPQDVSVYNVRTPKFLFNQVDELISYFGWAVR